MHVSGKEGGLPHVVLFDETGHPPLETYSKTVVWGHAVAESLQVPFVIPEVLPEIAEDAHVVVVEVQSLSACADLEAPEQPIEALRVPGPGVIGNV